MDTLESPEPKNQEVQPMEPLNEQLTDFPRQIPEKQEIDAD